MSYCDNIIIEFCWEGLGRYGWEILWIFVSLTIIIFYIICGLMADIPSSTLPPYLVEIGSLTPAHQGFALLFELLSII